MISHNWEIGEKAIQFQIWINFFSFQKKRGDKGRTHRFEQSEWRTKLKVHLAHSSCLTQVIGWQGNHGVLSLSQWQGACRALIVCPQCQLQPSNRPLWGLLCGGVQLCRLLRLRQLDEWISEWVDKFFSPIDLWPQSSVVSFFFLHPLQIVSINNHSNMPQKKNMLCHAWGCQIVFSLIDIGCIRSKCAHVSCALN